MLARIRKSVQEKDQGFTLIELLVVMIIIGILAAIAIPVFLSQRKKAVDTATKADVSTVGKEIATYFVDGSGTLTISQAGGAAGGAITLTDGTYSSGALKVSGGTALVTSPNAAAGFTASPTSATWCVAFTNAGGSTGTPTWKYSAGNGLQSGTC